MYEVTEGKNSLMPIQAFVANSKPASTTSSPAAAHPSSHASFYSGPIAHRQPYVSVRPSFSVPSLPVSAALSTIRQPIAAAARRVQAGTTYTRASTYTPPASSRDQRRSSVSSRTPLPTHKTRATHPQK